MAKKVSLYFNGVKLRSRSRTRQKEENATRAEARRLANEAAREAELASRLAEEEAERKRALDNEFNAYKKSINNAKQAYNRGNLKKKFLLLKIHPNKTREMRKKFGNAKSEYFNGLNHDAKTL